MAEPLKNSFGPDVPARIADWLAAVLPDFDSSAFLTEALDGFEELELTPRAHQIADALAAVLPGNREAAIEAIIESLGPEITASELTGMGSFVYLPFVFFVAKHGTEHFETSMRAQYELTKRFTAEFSIRAFLERYPRTDVGPTPGLVEGPERPRPKTRVGRDATTAPLGAATSWLSGRSCAGPRAARAPQGRSGGVCPPVRGQQPE